jgi:hypothetical protein
VTPQDVVPVSTRFLPVAPPIHRRVARQRRHMHVELVARGTRLQDAERWLSTNSVDNRLETVENAVCNSGFLWIEIVTIV